jgi:DNA polymerase III epsilon subunit-like protein
MSRDWYEDNPCWEEDRQEVIDWANRLLQGDFGNFVVLDTETTGLRNPEIIEIAVVSKYGSSMINTLVKNRKEVEPGAYSVHGISQEELSEAPDFCDIYPRLKSILEQNLVVIYNSSFDVRALFNTCKSWGLPRIKINNVCVMHKYAAYFGYWNSYYGNYSWQKLPNASHRAYGDAKATYELIKMMASGNDLGKEYDYFPHPMHSELFPPLQVACKWKPFLRLAIELPSGKSPRYPTISKSFELSYPKFYWLKK